MQKLITSRKRAEVSVQKSFTGYVHYIKHLETTIFKSSLTQCSLKFKNFNTT